MPSGAKKRKAAKKKKQSGAHTTINNTNNNTAGIDELKTQDSDGSGLSSPVSTDRDNNQSPFDVGGEEVDKRDPSAVGSFSTESKSMEGGVGNGEDSGKVGSDGEGVVEVVQELGSQGDAESKTISIEHVQSSKSSSRSSSSDDESREDEKKENGEEPSLTELVSEHVNQIIEKVTAVEVSKDESSSSSNPSDDESRVDEKKVTEEAHNQAVEEPSSSADLVPKDLIEPKEEAAVEEEIDVKECVSIQTSIASDVAVSVSEENGEKSLTKSDGLTGPSPSEVGSKPKNGEALPKVVSSSHNGTEHTKNSELPQYPENEHQLPVVAPRRVQATSWKGCCGLFEVLVGSNR